MMNPAELAAPASGHHDHERKAALKATSSALVQNVVDLDLVERVERALRISGYTPLREIKASICAHVVILRGQVSSYHMKQLAQVVALDVPGVRELRNEVQVAGST